MIVSKASIHCIGSQRNGFRPFLQRIKDAGRELALVKCRDDFGAAFEAREFFPNVITVGAFTKYDKFDNWNYAEFVSRARLNPHIEYWELRNEINGEWERQANFYIDLLPTMAADGLKLCAFNCATGTPQYPEIDPIPYAQIMQVCAFAKQNGYDMLLGLHEYSYDPHQMHRYRVLADYLQACNVLVPIAITEANDDSGMFTGVDSFVQYARDYDAVAINDPRVLGFALFTLGGRGWQGMNYETALPALGEYIATVEAVEPPPDPDPEPEPVKFAQWKVSLALKYGPDLTTFVKQRGGLIERIR